VVFYLYVEVCRGGELQIQIPLFKSLRFLNICKYHRYLSAGIYKSPQGFAQGFFKYPSFQNTAGINTSQGRQIKKNNTVKDGRYY
jgi:hypothetical protein